MRPSSKSFGQADKGFIGLWRATYLLPYPESPQARPDRRHPTMYRHSQVISADDAASVVRILRGRGAESISVERAPLPHPFFSGISKEYKTAFLRSLLFSIEGGASPGRAVEDLILSETGRLRTRFNVALDLLRNGRPFIEVMRALDIFDFATLSILEAGEQSGRLKNSINSALAHLEKSNVARNLMFTALSATSLDLLFAASSIIGIRFGLLPKIREDGPGSGATPQQVADFEKILGLATFGNDFLLALTAGMAIIICWGVFVYFGRNETMRERIDATMLKIPMIRPLYIHAAVSSTCSIMATLLRGGVTFLPATQITLRSTKLPTVRRYWERAHTQTAAGEAVARVMAADPMSHMEQMVLSRHTSATQLAEALEGIAHSRDGQARSASKRFGVFAFAFSILYSGLAVLLALAAVWAQSSAAMSGPGG